LRRPITTGTGHISEATSAGLVEGRNNDRQHRHRSCNRHSKRFNGFAIANGHEGKGEEEIRAAMGDKFPKHIYSFALERRSLTAIPPCHRVDAKMESLVGSFLRQPTIR
jgi:hypothetical protein